MSANTRRMLAITMFVLAIGIGLSMVSVKPAQSVEARTSTPMYDMREYFNLIPGNYWKYEGIFRHNDGAEVKFWQEYEVKEPLSTLIMGYKVFPVEIKRYPQAGYEDQDIGGYGGGYRHLKIYYYIVEDGIGLVGAEGFPDPPGSGVRSTPAPAPLTFCFQDADGTPEEPYLYSPLYIDDIQFGFAEWNKYFLIWQHCMTNIEYCNSLPSMSSNAKLVSRFEEGTVRVRTFMGPSDVDVIINKQGEKNGWCSREDWYLAEGIGMMKLLQWSCNDDHYNSGECTDLETPATGDHDYCGGLIEEHGARQVLRLVEYCRILPSGAQYCDTVYVE